jgi:processive 1,2-diacylglycerol beta-glucosyltransferase
MPSRPTPELNRSGSRILVLTAGFGEGHNAAARALTAAFDEALGPGSARMVDAFALASPRLNALTRRAYFAAINRTPRLWGRLYQWIDRSEALPARVSMMRPLNRLLAELVESERPEAVCSAFPLYGILLERLRAQGRFRAPHFMVVTDSISINSLWWKTPCSGWFVPNEDSAEVLLQAGVDPARVQVQGFPVALEFEDLAGQLCPPELSAGAKPRVLHIVHSGKRHAEETARLLLTETEWEITCTVGRDERLRRRLTELAARRPHRTEVLGWTNQIPRLLLTHHAVVSKAGGATTQEAIAARCPMIVSQIVPGQEEGNYELLRRHGAGALAETPGAVLSELRRAFAERGAVWHRWRSALDSIARPAAARAIAAHVLAEAKAFHASPAP